MKVLVDMWPHHDCGRECKQYGKIDPRKRRGRFFVFEIMGHALTPFRRGAYTFGVSRGAKIVLASWLVGYRKSDSIDN
jgi:hypothetical protein